MGQARIKVQLNGSSQEARVNVTPAPGRLVSISPLHTDLRQGATAQFVVTVKPRRSEQAHQIQLTSSDTRKVTVPSSVTVPAGAGSVTFVARGVALGHAHITARLQHRGQRSAAAAHVEVIASAPSLAALLPATTSLQKGATAQLTVSLTSAHGASTSVALAARTQGVLQLPASVVVPPGQTQAVFAVQALETGNTLVAASLGATTVEAAVQVLPLPAQLAGLQPRTSTIAVSALGQLQVQLAAAQSTTTTVALSSEPTGIVQVPATVHIPAGSLSADIAVTGVAAGQADVVATLAGNTRRATVVVTALPAQLVSLLPSPLALQTGASAQMTVRLNAAQGEAVEVDLDTAQSQLLQVPDTVTIPAGQIEQSFAVHALAAGQAQVIARLNGVSRQATVNIAAPPPRAASLQPAAQDIPKGKLGKLILTLDRAPQAATPVNLGNTNPACCKPRPRSRCPQAHSRSTSRCWRCNKARRICRPA